MATMDADEVDVCLADTDAAPESPVGLPCDLLEDMSADSTLLQPLLNNEENNVYSISDAEDEIEEPASQPLKSISVKLPSETLIHPKSCYEGFEPPYTIMSERKALDLLLPTKSEDDDFLELELTEFVVYCDSPKSPQEMRPLSHLDTEVNSPRLYFDGALSNGTTSLYVQRVPIHSLPIGNYGQESMDLTADNIWLQSERNSSTDIYYKLKAPAPEYKRFWDPFLWVADLAKHLVDYLTSMHDAGQRVNIHHFRNAFSTWILVTHSLNGNIHHVRRWMAKCPRLDYRAAINANVGFLYKESIGALGQKKTEYHDVWAEIFHFTKYTPYQPKIANTSTVVTNYIYNCFSHLPFGSQLQAVDFSDTTKQLRASLMAEQPITTIFSLQSASHTSISSLEPGDTISTARDTEQSGSVWKKEDAKDDSHVERWFALIQGITLDSRGKRLFEVIWYYRPVDTLCGLMKYPWSNELFLSDHCSCGEAFKIREDEVMEVHDVDFGGTPDTLKEFFCRQVYMSEERIWVTLTQSHLTCPHAVNMFASLDHAPEYACGETLLVHVDLSSKLCEPCEVVKVESDLKGARYTVRRFLRRRDVDPKAPSAPPNEVVYTAEEKELSSSRIIGRCHVRWFQCTETIPTPYDRDGVGAFFYFTRKMSRTAIGPVFTILEQPPLSLKQGYNPHRRDYEKLKGLDLFCGGGSFGRGLEEGGSVEMKWANDMDTKALHTYMANTSGPEQVSPFLGSIDDFQRLAIEGIFSNNVPKVGDVEFISGGSPCPGFSAMTNDKTTAPQRKNQSLVAAFASCVDLYRPKYGVLENVVGIIQKNRNRDQDVFSQLMCALVGMGYQARLFFLDALSCGSAQLRPRVFIIFAAPGWVLPEAPLQTHSHPPNVKNLGLGRLPTGESMAKREISRVTPFKFRSAAEATEDLPKIYDGKPDICVAYPDHRVVSHTNTKTMRTRVGLIPKFPYGMNFSQAWYGLYGLLRRAAGQGVLTKAERDQFAAGPAGAAGTTSLSATGSSSHAYGRVSPTQPMCTIVTRATPGDAKLGRTIHWDEHRCLSVMEARRAQGFRDEEVLLGNPPVQYKMIGNSVAREVSLALGVVITDAVIRSHSGNSQDVVVEEQIGSATPETTSPFWETPETRLGSPTPITSASASPGTWTPRNEETVNKRQRRE